MNNDAFLKSQCNRYVNGFCQNTSCLKRGLGERPWDLPIDFNKAACEYHEILLELEELRGLSENLKNELAGEDL